MTWISFKRVHGGTTVHVHACEIESVEEGGKGGKDHSTVALKSGSKIEVAEDVTSLLRRIDSVVSPTTESAA